MKIHTVLVLAGIAALPVAWLLAGKAHRFAYWIATKSDSQVHALAKDGWLVDRLQVADGVELVGLVRPPKNPNARWVMFVPGNSTALLDGFQAVLDELRGDDDVGLAFWGYRGFDASTGTPNPQALQADLMPQWNRLLELGATAERTEIWGYSLGAALAPHLAADLCKAGTPPNRLVLVATGMEIPVRPHGLFGRFSSSDIFEGHSVAARVTCPVAIAQGSEDAAMPIAGAQQLAKKFGTEVQVIEGKGHVDLWPDTRTLLWAK